MTYRSAILSIAKSHGIIVRETATNTWHCAAYHAERAIKVVPINNYITFIIALHEIGHLVGTRTNNRMLEEIRAWKNARHIAGKYWNKKAAGIMYYALDLYATEKSFSKLPNKMRQIITFFHNSKIEKIAV